MPVSQRFIDLLNMPLGALRSLADELEVDVTQAADKWAVARAVAAAPRQNLEEASDGFLYAGRTSLSWFRFVDEDEEIDGSDVETFRPLDGDSVDAGAVLDALPEHSEGDPFSEVERPAEITREPKLVVARDWRDGVLMTFAVAKRVTRVIRSFEVEDVLEDEFFLAFLRPADGTFEVRASAARAKQLHTAWLSDFAETLGMLALPVAITEADVREFRDEIGGRVDKYGGTDATGTSAIGSVTYAKADTADDLFEEEEFEDATEGYDPVSYDLLFDYEDDDVEGEDIRVHVSTTRGSVFIQTAVPESVVRFVYSAMRSAKA